jgi:hypothetical protein
MAHESEILFVKYDLRAVLEAHEGEMLSKIDAINQDELLGIDVEQLCDYYEAEYRVDVPRLDESAVTVDQQESQIDVSRDPGRLIHNRDRPLYITGTEVTFFVPFEGDATLFHCAASTRSSMPPRAIVGSNELLIVTRRPNLDAEAARTDFDRELSGILQHLAWITKDVEPFNAGLRAKAKGRIQARREKTTKDKGVVSELGFPLRRIEDATPTYVVPAVRKKPPFPTPSPGRAASAPEPELAMSQYEEILSIIENMIAVIERSPHAFVSMSEEDLRQHFLVQLNGQYEGQATGETFNYDGKTDILIRHEGKNLFIAECKFWKGSASLTKAIDQLLGYVSWRDTKTAIILFNRTKNFSSILQQVPGEVRKHPNFIREEASESETRFRFALHHRNDPDREIVLTVLCFDVPT